MIRLLALDLGRARTGVAFAQGGVAVPLDSLSGTVDPERLQSELLLLLGERPVDELICGLPIDLRGRQGPAAQAIRDIAGPLAHAVAPLPVRLVDERLTTRVADRRLGEVLGDARARRGRVDAWAAVALLEGVLARITHTGEPGGEIVDPHQCRP